MCAREAECASYVDMGLEYRYSGCSPDSLFARAIKTI